MKRVELLAPAGSFEALEAAVMSGADAVYLGGFKFGARAFAANFDKITMIKAVNYAHLYGVRIYVTVNTLIYDDEVTEFLEYISFLNEIGVDALIIQDLGMMHLISKTYPNLELHASTQMHIHNVKSLKKLKSIGVKRVVLPRELSIAEISTLKKESDMDIEIFIHGALCVSYSGQCLMSYLIGGRSGNRGECAGSCRLPYELVEQDNDGKKVIKTDGKYLLSTKDLYTIDNIDKIIEAGVDSLKIEGRMKRPEYVAIVVSLYRKAIDSYYEGLDFKVSSQEVINLKKMFNRGFTKGYLFSDKNKSLMNPLRPNHLGTNLGKITKVDKKNITIKLNDDISLGDGIRIISNNDIGFSVNRIYKDGATVQEAFKGDVIKLDKVDDVKVGLEVLKTSDVKLINKLKREYQANRRKIKISGSVTGHIGDELILNVSDGKINVTVKNNTKISKAINNPVTKVVILEKLNKIGDTPYIFENIDVTIDDDIFIPLASINVMKREALNKLSELRVSNHIVDKPLNYKLEAPDVWDRRIRIKAKIRTMDQYRACIYNNIDMIYVENYKLYQEVKADEKVVLSLPRVLKRELTQEEEVLVGDLGSVSPKSITDFSLNVINSYTVAFMHSLGVKTITLSYEMDFNKIGTLIGNYKKRYNKLPSLEVIVYGRIEAMIMEYCPLNTHLNKDNKTCSVCNSNSKYFLRDRFGNDYLIKSDGCVTNIYDYKRLNYINNINKMIELGITNFRFNFVDETYEECNKVFSMLEELKMNYNERIK